MSIKGIIIIIIIAAIICLLYLAFRKKKPEKRAKEQKSLADLTVVDAKIGDVLTVHGAGDEYDDLSFTVDRRNRYESSKEEAFELSGKYRNRRVYLEYCEEDELEVLLMSTPTLTIEEVGVTEERLVEMDEKPSTANTIAYKNVTWRYESSSEISFFKDCQGPGEGFYSWEFVSDDGRQKLIVEKWVREPFEARIADKITPSDIVVYRS